jgi:MOSC domain-containing protein
MALDSSNTRIQPGNGTNALGIVARLWRYPVKSMLGEQCEYLDVDPCGVAGDRLFAIRDANGKFGSGKSTRRFHRIDGLFGFQAVYEGEVPAILFPDSRTMRGDHPDIHTALSHTLGQPVTLAREASIPHLDAGPVHLLTTAAFAWLRAALPDVPADERRFRPNLVVDVPGATQVERGWLGKTLSVGNAVRLRVSAATERCGMVAFAQRGLPDDARILRCIAQEAALHFGVYAEVLVPGRIKRGDSVTVVDQG